MLKALLLATVIAWPFTAIAQDAPSGDAPTPGPKPAAIEKVIAKICATPVTTTMAAALAKDYVIALVFDTPLASDTVFVRNMIFETKETGPSGQKSIIELATFMVDGEVKEQCVSSFGGYDGPSVEKMKQAWKDHPAAAVPFDKSGEAPLTNAPAAGTATTPSFQANPDE